MELIIIVVTTLLILLFSAGIRKQKPTTKQLQKLQQEIDKSDAQENKRFGINWHHDAVQEFTTERIHISGFISLLSGLGLAALFIVSVVFISFDEMTLIMMCISVIILIVNGLLIFIESEFVSLLVLGILSVLGVIVAPTTEFIPNIDPSVYGYLAILLLFCGGGLFTE